MSENADPIVGAWYEHLDRGQRFEVIDVDEDRGVVEIQYADGDLDEMDLDDWHDLEIEPIERSEDLTDVDEPSGDRPGRSEAEDSSRRSKRRKHDWDEDEEEDDLDEEGDGEHEED